MKAEPRHNVPRASPSVKRPDVCFSIIVVIHVAGKNTSMVNTTLTIPANDQSNMRRIIHSLLAAM
jgi:hypothetical protein